MTRRTLSFVAFGLMGLVLAVGILAASHSATAAPPDNAASQAEHARVVEFWTAERIAAAVPRELVVDRSASAPGLLAKPENPGGGNGGGAPTLFKVAMKPSIAPPIAVLAEIQANAIFSTSENGPLSTSVRKSQYIPMFSETYPWRWAFVVAVTFLVGISIHLSPI